MAPVPTVELDAQYRLLREEAGHVKLSGRVVIEVRGPDGAEFLQGQLTNEIEGLEPGRGCYAALLDRKGKMRADMSVLRIAADLIWVETATATADEVERHLDTYRIGREVEIERRDELGVISLIGPRSAELLGGKPLGAEYSHGIERIAEHDLRVVSSEGGADLIGTAEALAAAADQLSAAGAEVVSDEAAAIVRVEAGRPAFGAEMGNDTLTAEAGINDRAVNFKKGCYIGQETVARLHYKGKPNRHLRRLISPTPLQTGVPVTLGEKQIGVVGTAVISPARGPLALAILRREAEPGDEVLVDGTTTARVEEIGA